MRTPDSQILTFDLQRFCVHDGPGIRSVLFFKGCPMRCVWCQNPESLLPVPQTAFYPERCAGCMTCAGACPNGAIQDGSHRIDRSRCKACGHCAEACPHEALRTIGRYQTPEELLESLLLDRSYYQASAGGVTLSGGEPLLQAAPTAKLLGLCRRSGLHSVLETCGEAPWETMASVLDRVDLFFFDLKAGTDPLHQQLTGRGSDRVRANARRLVEASAAVEFRMPVVPGFNDTPESLGGIGQLLRELGHRSIHLLPYHAGGESKIDRIGSDQRRLGIFTEQSRIAISLAARTLQDLGIEVAVVGGDQHAPNGTGPEPFPERVWKLRTAVQSTKPSLCAERAVLVTEYFRDGRNRRKPMIIQKAEALLHLFQKRRAVIHDHELLVGNFSSKRVGGSLFPELHGVAMMEDLLSFDHRAVNPLNVDPGERRTLALKVLPFWLTRFLAAKAFPPAKALRFIAGQAAGGKYLINETGGIAHFVPDFAALLQLGTSGIAEKAQRLSEAPDAHDHLDFYRAVKIACRALEALAAPYAELAGRMASDEPDLQRRAELDQISRVCALVPRKPAETLHQALQSILFAQIALNLEGLDNAISPGRLDQILLPSYRADLAAGRIDERGARELIGCFTVKMSEIVPVFSRRLTRYHGGMFNGQVVVVGGTDREGRDATNELTWMFLEAMDALRMRQPNYHARVHTGSPAAYLERVADMLRRGSAAPSLMNDDVVVPMLVGRGTKEGDARDYSPVGCVEPVACGATFGSTDAALVNLAVALEWTLGTKRGGARVPPLSNCRVFDEVVDHLAIQIEHLVGQLISDLLPIEHANARFHPTPLASMLLRGCLESGEDASAGGASYNGSGVQGIGVIDLADSLAAIDAVVFQRKLCDLPTLVHALHRDFAGYEGLRGYLLRAPKFGNEDPAVDKLANRVVAIFSNALGRHRNSRGGAYWAGFYSVTSHEAFGRMTGALPSGRCAGKPLANGLSPANGSERLGPTAALNSVAKLDLIREARNGINVNLKLDATAIGGPGGAFTLASLIRGYFTAGGMQLQANVLDPATLRDAIDHPELHPWLLVRVSGYSAYFNDLSPGMKQEILDRHTHSC